MFEEATRHQTKLRLGLVGPAGSGKTFTALRVAHAMFPNGKIAVLDTEHKSASKYVGEEVDGRRFKFLAAQLTNYDPDNYIRAIRFAEAQGYDVLIIDSLSHAWAGVGGLLEQKDRAAARIKNDYTAWRDITPKHNQLVEAMLASKIHLIVTMRAKTEYILEEDSRGKKVPRKVGMAPVQRDGLEYEFDVVGDLDTDNRLLVSKTRCSALRGAVLVMPGEDLARTLMDWLSQGSPAAEDDAPPPPAAAPSADGHNPSWAADQKRFFAALGELGVDYDNLKGFCAAKGMPKPSAMDQGARERLVKRLREPSGLGALREWERTEAQKPAETEQAPAPSAEAAK